jgi:hypothetical protein
VSAWDHGEICDYCGLGAGVHRAEGGVSVRSRGGYEAPCSCGRVFGPEVSGEEALDLLGEHVMTVEDCPCPEECHKGTHWPRSIGDRGD